MSSSRIFTGISPVVATTETGKGIITCRGRCSNMVESSSMATERFNFPKDFLWGTATAAHQVEGNNVNNDYWVLEHTPGSPFFEPSGDACDQYHRYPEDIAMLARLGFNAYRFSIEWARVEPEPGEFSIAALDHYRRVLASCHEHKITPIDSPPIVIALPIILAT